VTDTLKRVEGGRVVATVPRAGLVRAQTPQGARVPLLRRAHAAAAAPAANEDGAVGTDDVALIERLGEPVEVVPGEAWNVKITTAEDRAWAEAWLARAGGRET
jgi:2-C-methyl-D-erythritol 4-phosphate cytidylyltransferase